MATFQCGEVVIYYNPDEFVGMSGDEQIKILKERVDAIKTFKQKQSLITLYTQYTYLHCFNHDRECVNCKMTLLEYHCERTHSICPFIRENAVSANEISCTKCFGRKLIINLKDSRTVELCNGCLIK